MEVFSRRTISDRVIIRNEPLWSASHLLIVLFNIRERFQADRNVDVVVDGTSLQWLEK